MSSRLAAAASIALTLAAPLARAQSAADVATARELFKEGAALVQQGKWEEARDRYERSLELKRSPMTLYSLGVTQRYTGRLVEALESFRAFVAEHPVPATEPWQAPAKEAIAELEKKVGALRIVVAPAGLAGLAVRVDGKEIPAAALDRRRLVNPGAHEIVVSATGYRDARASVTVAEGGTRAIDLTLERAPEAAPIAPIAPIAPQLPAPGAPPAQPDPGPREAPRAPSRALPFALIGAGAAALGAGIAVGMIGVGEARSAPTRDGSEANQARVKMLAGDIVGGLGIAAAGAGVVVLIVQQVTQKPAKAAKLVGVTPWMTAREAGVLVRF